MPFWVRCFRVVTGVRSRRSVRRLHRFYLRLSTALGSARTSAPLVHGELAGVTALTVLLASHTQGRQQDCPPSTSSRASEQRPGAANIMDVRPLRPHTRAIGGARPRVRTHGRLPSNVDRVTAGVLHSRLSHPWFTMNEQKFGLKARTIRGRQVDDRVDGSNLEPDDGL
jgi:hypothetical protein